VTATSNYAATTRAFIINLIAGRVKIATKPGNANRLAAYVIAHHEFLINCGKLNVRAPEMR